ncbi:MAG: hypothetical protein WDO56_14850 [Gammaproteobacteria bacterium]
MHIGRRSSEDDQEGEILQLPGSKLPSLSTLGTASNSFSAGYEHSLTERPTAG